MSMMTSLILKFVESPKTQISEHLESESYKRLWYGKKWFSNGDNLKEDEEVKRWSILGAENRSIIHSLYCLIHEAWNHTTRQCIWIKIPFIKDTPQLRYHLVITQNESLSYLVNNCICGREALRPVSFRRE